MKKYILYEQLLLSITSRQHFYMKIYLLYDYMYIALIGNSEYRWILIEKYKMPRKIDNTKPKALEGAYFIKNFKKH